MTPLVTIGVPVFNEERFLAEALDSLLAQTFTDFELVIADNASTDGTESIGRSYAQRDSRIRYVRHRSNVGAPANWNFLVTVARGAYFKWASANDTCAPKMLADCVALLSTNPDVVLCYGRTELVDDAGHFQLFEGDIDVSDARPSERFSRVCRHLTMNNAQCGLIRHDALMKTRLDRPYPRGDMVLMAELSLLGQFRLLPGIHLYRRTGRGAMTTKLSPEELAQIYRPGARSAFRALTARLHFDYLATVLRSPIPLSEKAPAVLGVLRRAAWSRSKMWQELRSLLAA